MAFRFLMTFTWACVAFSSVSMAKDWTRFRGPNGSGVLECGPMPSTLGPGPNNVFRVDVPSGRSSPVLTDDLVFLTGREEGRFVVLCLDAETGEEFWRRRFEPARQADMYQGNDSASPTPVTDGENVYVFFQELGLIAIDPEGEVLWTSPLGPFQSFYGVSASPLVWEDYVILLCDQRPSGFLMAVDRSSGDVAWKAAREGFWESWTSPVIHEDDQGRSLIVTVGNKRAVAYEADTGKLIWEFDGLGPAPVASPIIEGQRLYTSTPNQSDQQMPGFDSLLGTDRDGNGVLSLDEFSGTGFEDHFGWCDVDGNGSVSREEWDSLMAIARTKTYGVVALDLSSESEDRELWRYRRAPAYIATPLLYQDVLYIVKDGGIVTSLNPKNGEVLKSERVAAGGECYPSPVASDGKVYIPTNDGRIVVLGAGAQWRVLAINDLGEEIRATPAIAGGRLYVRTSSKLMAFAQSGDG